jgi:hypothetical protein
MKTVMNNFKMMAIGLTAAFTVLLSNVTLANNEKNENDIAELQYAGKKQNLPVFRLVLSNSNNTEYIITVKESNGDILFSEKLKGNNISRMYQLDAENSDLIAGTVFEVTNKTTKITTLYKVSNFTKSVDEIYISKL